MERLEFGAQDLWRDEAAGGLIWERGKENGIGWTATLIHHFLAARSHWGIYGKKTRRVYHTYHKSSASF